MATGRQIFSFPRTTKDQLEALASIERFGGNQSEVAREAIDRLWHSYFRPTSIAPDAVLEQAARRLRLALAGLEGEIARRTALADRLEDDA